MSVDTPTLRWVGILIGFLFIAAALTACSDSTESTPTRNGDSGAWEEYEAFCSEAAQEELDDNEDYTNGEVSTFYAKLVERMEALDPPGEIADWHDRLLAGWTAVKRLIDAEPQDAIFDPLILFSDSEVLSLFGEVEEAFNAIPADVRERLAAAGCSDDADSEPTGEGESDTPQPDSTATPRGVPTPTQTPAPPDSPTPQPVATQTTTPTVTPGPTSDTPISTVTSPSARDRDGDGLIEVDNLTQLDAIRWDLDGDGISDNADYAIAFSDADTGTMCSVAGCAGYELTANLDFDTNENGEADEGDVYWNSGDGWVPIGESNDPFDTTFEGGGRTISNLYIRRSPNVGLFGVLGSGSTVSGIGLVDTNVGASGYGTAGALAGIGLGVIEDSFADGLVAGCVDHIGGLVGLNDGSIANSRSAGNVASARRSSRSALGVIADLINDLIDFPLFGSGSRTCYASGGGLVGENSGTIASSHSTSVVSGFTDNFGGLAGVNSGVIAASYATGSVSGKGYAGRWRACGRKRARRQDHH